MIKIDKKNLVIIILTVVVFISLLFKSFTYDDEVIIEDNLNEILVINNVNYSSVILNEVAEEKEKIKVHITGEVIEEGIVLLNEGDRIEDAIYKAGGLTKDADLSKVNLAYELQDAQKVYIPSLNEEVEEYIDESAGESVIEDEGVSGKRGGKVNLNTATTEELQTISGIGKSTADKIISYRNLNGKFKSIEDLKNVSGIGEKKFEDIKNYITV